MGSCKVIVRKNQCLILTVQKNAVGLGFLAPPFFRVAVENMLPELGEAIIESLNASGNDFDSANRQPDAVLEFAGVRSWSMLERKCASFLISHESDGSISIIPTVPAPKGGRLHKPDEACSCSPNAAEIALAFSEMLAKHSEPS